MTNKRSLSMVFAVSMFFVSFCVSQERVASNAEQIRQLLTQVCAHTGNPEQLLDPQLSTQDKNRNAAPLNGKFELQITPRVSVDTVSEVSGEMTVPARVFFKTQNRELNIDANLEFVRRKGNWYFKNFNFLHTPTWLIVFLIAGLVVGILYAIGVVTHLWRVLKRSGVQLRVADLVKAFVPFFWFRANRHYE